MNALIIAMIVLFIHATTWQGMIFGAVQEIIRPEGWLYKPIYGCPICMTPWWGSLIYAIFFHISWQDWFLTIFCASGMSVISVVLLSIRDACLAVEEKFGE